MKRILQQFKEDRARWKAENEEGKRLQAIALNRRPYTDVTPISLKTAGLNLLRGIGGPFQALFKSDHYHHPYNDHVVSVHRLSVFIGAVTLGPLFFVFTGQWGEAVGNFILILILTPILLGWIPWIASALTANYQMQQKWLSRGYIQS